MLVSVRKDSSFRDCNACVGDWIWGHIATDVPINPIHNGLMGCVNAMMVIVRCMGHVCQMEPTLEMTTHPDAVQEHISILPNVDVCLVLSAV